MLIHCLAPPSVKGSTWLNTTTAMPANPVIAFQYGPILARHPVTGAQAGCQAGEGRRREAAQPRSAGCTHPEVGWCSRSAGYGVRAGPALVSRRGKEGAGGQVAFTL